MPQQLADIPELPRLAVHVWSWFLELDSSRGNSGFSHFPITYADLKAWQEMTRIRLEPWEVSALRRLDAAYIKSVAETQRNET